MLKKFQKKKTLTTDNRLLNKQSRINKFALDYKKEENSESTSEILYENIQNKYLRCIKCNLIPALNLDIKNHSVHLKCTCGTQKNININDYLEQGYINNFNNKICNFCNNIIDLKNLRKFFYCKECEIYFCKFCISIHDQNYENHHYLNLEKYDTNCIFHRESYGYFCSSCNENICKYCLEEKHLNHNIIDLDNINLKRKEIKKIKDNCLKEKENFIKMNNYIKKLLINLQKEINQLLEYKESELEFKKNIIYSYDTKIDNYYTISNIKNLNFNLNNFQPEENISNSKINTNNSHVIDELINFYKYINSEVNLKLDNNSDSLKESSTKTDIISMKKSENLADSKQNNRQIEHIATSIEIVSSNKKLPKENSNKKMDIINEKNGKFNKFEDFNIDNSNNFNNNLDDSNKKYENEKIKKKELIRINYINIPKCLNNEEDNNTTSIFKNKINFVRTRNKKNNTTFENNRPKIIKQWIIILAKV